MPHSGNSEANDPKQEWPPKGLRYYYADAHSVIIHGDCREILPTVSADVAIMDPPYDISASSGGIGGRRQYLSDIRGHIDAGFDVSILDSESFSSWVCFCGKSQLVELIQKAEEHQGFRWQLITWNKTNPTPLSNGNYLPDAEYIIHAFEKLPDCDYRAKSRWILGPVEQNPFAHPTVKPLYVMARVIESSTAMGQTIVDPYMGSGSTLVAAKMRGVKAIGIELEEKYVEIAVERLRQEILIPA